MTLSKHVSFSGGTEDMEYLPIQMFRQGIVGCVGELSIGRSYAIDLIHKAKNGRNVDTCNLNQHNEMHNLQ